MPTGRGSRTGAGCSTPHKLLLDPYARAVSGRVDHDGPVHGYRRTGRPGQELGARCDDDSAPYVPRSVVVRDDFDWGEDEQVRPRTSWIDTVVYELHVKGFTKLHQEVPEQLRGTYAGLSTDAAVHYLKDLGVTAVELLPVHQSSSEPHVVRAGLSNYWGYNSLGYFAPHNGYGSSGDRGEQVTEFKTMVKALHAAGLEVILDVVYNHTAEGGPEGPTLSWRGLDAAGYYQHVDARAGDMRYFDVTGCGNTVDASHPMALRMILDSLRYWVTEMHVDGFRFDLTPALTRTGHHVDLDGHFISAVNQDPVLRHVKLIAEPWDASMDGYLVGRFPPPWCEWNDKYRDTVRDFWRLESGGIRDIASRLSGSSDLYADDGRSPYASVNFVTAHDGFTLRDLVSYDRKHNEDEPRGQPGRQRQQPLVELRCRGRDRRPGDHRAAAQAGRQPAGDAVPVRRGPDDHRRRRARAHAARQQQRLLPGQRDLLDGLAARRRVARPVRRREDRACGCGASTRPCGSATSSRAGRP